MDVHEFQAKTLLGRYGVAVPEGFSATTPDEARWAAQRLGGGAVVVKAQIHSGGRGKAGGVARVEGADAAATAAANLLGRRLTTAQTGARGLPIHTVWVEQATDCLRELYLSLLIDRAVERVALLACASGGMEIETLVAQQPEAMLTTYVDPAAGLMPYQCRELAYGMQLAGVQVSQFVALTEQLYRLFVELDCSQIELNPLAVAADGQLIALDAKINFDDNGLFLHPDVMALRDPTQQDPQEYAALQHNLSYVALDGNVGCMVNGAGLAMATLDLIKLHGGAPANFLDVGGGATAERVAEAFRLILAQADVRAVLVNIFGGIVRCDLIAEGVIRAMTEVGVRVPVIVRLEGTNADAGRALLNTSGLNVISAADLTEAARQAVAAAKA